MPATPTTEASAPTTEAGLTGAGFDVGLLAPSPGLLATLFLGQERGTEFATDDVNGGGGVLDGPLTVTNSVAEPGAEPTANVQAAVEAGAQALIGPAGSSDIIEVRDEVASLGSTACSASASVPVGHARSGSALARPHRAARRRHARPISPPASSTDATRSPLAPPGRWRSSPAADSYGQSVGNSLAAILQSAGLQPSVVGYNPRRVRSPAPPRRSLRCNPT